MSTAAATATAALSVNAVVGAAAPEAEAADTDSTPDADADGENAPLLGALARAATRAGDTPPPDGLLLLPRRAHAPLDPPPLRSPLRAMVFLMCVQVLSSAAYAAFNAVLALFFNLHLHYDQSTSTALDAVFMVVAALASPLGGILSDKLFGNAPAQLGAYMLWTVGSAVLLLTVVSPVFAALGGPRAPALLALALVAIVLQGLGYGIVNTIQAVLVGDQYAGVPEAKVSSSFSTFYFFSNIGSFVGEAGGPIMRRYTNWTVTGTALLVCVALTTVLFAVGMPAYRRVPPQRARREPAARRALVEKTTTKASFLAAAAAEFRAIRAVLLVFVPMPVFWFLFNQQNNTWVFQAKHMARDFGGWRWLPWHLEVPPDLMPSLEDIFCLVLIHVFDRIVYPACERCGRPLNALHRTILGFVFMILSFVLSGVLQAFIALRAPAKLSVAWQIPQQFTMAVAEVTVCIAMLDFAYQQTPEGSRGTVNAVWQLTAAFGTGLLFLLSLAQIPNGALTFFVYAGVMALLSVVFVVIATLYPWQQSTAATAATAVPRRQKAGEGESGAADEDERDAGRIGGR